MNFLGRNILQTISQNLSLLSEEFDMDDTLQIDDSLPMKNLKECSSQANFVDGVPVAGHNTADVALAKAGHTAAAAQSAIKVVEHVKIAVRT